MPKPSPRQRKTMGRVMHEFKHGELERSRRQGRQGQKPPPSHRHRAEGGRRLQIRERAREQAQPRQVRAQGGAGDTHQQEREGKSHVGARGRRESSAAMGGKNATRTARGRKAARARARSGDATKEQLYRRAKARDILGRSKMSKRQLENALQ